MKRRGTALLAALGVVMFGASACTPATTGEVAVGKADDGSPVAVIVLCKGRLDFLQLHDRAPEGRSWRWETPHHPKTTVIALTETAKDPAPETEGEPLSFRGFEPGKEYWTDGWVAGSLIQGDMRLSGVDIRGEDFAALEPGHVLTNLWWVPSGSTIEDFEAKACARPETEPATPSSS